MSQFKKSTSKGVVRTIAIILTFAMVATSVAFTPGSASAKKAKVSRVKMFSKTLVLAKGKSMKLKPEVKVTPNKKANKKVTYKSSNSKIISVSKTGKIKARGKKGKKAKITITSKLNKKKKVTVTVKIGTPVKSIKIKSGGKVTKSMTISDGKGRQLKIAYTPKKATYRAVSWKSSKTSVATINEYGILIPRKPGTATITATTKDGSNKKAKCTVKVLEPKITTSPAPTKAPDNRKRTMVEDFEKYPIGTKWNITYAIYPNAATATVVQDPTNKNNKVLRVAYDGTQQAYDVAPYFTVDLTKLPEMNDSTKLDDFVALNFKTKVESNSADCRYKPIACYFADAGTLKPGYFFATSLSINDELHKFKVDDSMAKGVDKTFTDTATGKQDNHRYFPGMVDNYETNKSNCYPGFVEAQNDSKVPFTERTLEFNKSKMRDPITKNSLLEKNNVDFIFGSTYTGNYKSQGLYLTLYIDDIQLLSAPKVGLKGIDLKLSDNKVGTGLERKIRYTFDPATTTETSLVWKSSDESIATVDESTGKVTGIKPGTVTITATSKTSPGISKTIQIEVYEAGTAEEDLDLDLENIVVGSGSDVDAKIRSDAGAEYRTDELGTGLYLNYTSENQSIVLDLGREMDFSQYKSLEIVGRTPGSVAIELYDSSFDKSGSVDEWWNTNQGAAYPFYNGSCSLRLEDGGYNKDDIALAEETFQIGWNKLSDGEKRDGDFTKIRYIVLKSNQAATGGYGQDNYLIKRITLSTKEEVQDYLPIALTKQNESLLTKDSKYASAEFGENRDENGVLLNKWAQFVSNAQYGSGIGFYIDEIKETGASPASGGAVTAAHKDAVDISGYRYAKVKVETTSNDKLMLVGLKAGQTWPMYSLDSTPGNLLSEKVTAPDKRTIYFSLKSLTNKDLTEIDVLGIKSSVNGSTVKINSFDLVKGEPLIVSDEEKATTFIVKK